MTSTRAREGTLGPTIASLQNQTRPPDAIRLYLPVGVTAPADVDIHWLDQDPGPVAKVSAALDPALRAFTMVVTVDDDQVYEPAWLETLVLAAERQGPNTAVGLSGWNVDDFLRRPHVGTYQWVTPPRSADVLEGWAGVVYRVGWFDADILAPPEPFRLVDDVWISSYLARRKGIGRFVAGHPMSRDPAKRPGLHHRDDFVELNRRAAVLGFGQSW